MENKVFLVSRPYCDPEIVAVIAKNKTEAKELVDCRFGSSDFGEKRNKNVREVIKKGIILAQSTHYNYNLSELGE